MTRLPTLARPALGVLTAAALLTGCGVPIPPEVPDTSGPRQGSAPEGDVDRLEPEDTRTAELTTALRTLAARVAEARDLLLAVEAASGVTDDATTLGAEAVGALLGPPGGGDAPGVLPAVDPDRGGTASDDLVTALITLASDTGGERGRLVLELVRDPMLGDLGAWQRDPVGVITVLRTIAGASDASGAPVIAVRDARMLDAEFAALPGEMTRALGYALVVASADDPTLAAHAATQAAGRLGVVLIALELAAERLEGPA